MDEPLLTKGQIAILEAVGGDAFLSKQFYLTGGTALAAFYLHHRYSEDLDFFSEDEIDHLSLNVFFTHLKKSLPIEKVDFQRSYNRNLYFLHMGGEVLKTEFTYFPFPRIEKNVRAYNVSIDSLIDIAVNKLFTIYQRTAARDYIDLYAICATGNMTLERLMSQAKAKFDWPIDPLQLGTQLINAREARDYPRLITKIGVEDWRNFFERWAIQLKKEIME